MGAAAPSPVAQIVSANRVLVRCCRPPATAPGRKIAQLVANRVDDTVEVAVVPDHLGQHLARHRLRQTKITASTRSIHSRKRSGGGRSAPATVAVEVRWRGPQLAMADLPREQRHRRRPFRAMGEHGVGKPQGQRVRVRPKAMLTAAISAAAATPR